MFVVLDLLCVCVWCGAYCWRGTQGAHGQGERHAHLQAFFVSCAVLNVWLCLLIPLLSLPLLPGCAADAYTCAQVGISLTQHHRAITHFTAGNMLAAAGKLVEGGEHYKEAIRLQPSFELAQQALRRVMCVDCVAIVCVRVCACVCVSVVASQSAFVLALPLAACRGFVGAHTSFRLWPFPLKSAA